jgi:hypothetical protein
MTLEGDDLPKTSLSVVSLDRENESITLICDTQRVIHRGHIAETGLLSISHMSIILTPEADKH